MSIRAMYAGVSGLSSHQQVIDVIGNNIANVNTVGFKGGRATFADIFSQTLSGASAGTGARGGTNPRQIGLGTNINAVDTIFTQGTFQQSGRLLDLGIQGSGFFMLTDNINGQGQTFYTRAGNFSLDSSGHMINPANGLAVLGRIATDGVVTGTERLQGIRVDFGATAPAVVTTSMAVDGNLSSATSPRVATGSISLVSLFDPNGNPLELRAGDVIEFKGGSIGGNGLADEEILTITNSTTLDDLARAIQQSLVANASDQTSVPQVDLRSDGTLRFTAGNDALSNVRIGVRGQTNQAFEKVFIDSEGDLDIDLAANAATFTRAFRQADLTSTIDVFDSQGNARAVALSFAKDTKNLAALGVDRAINLTDEFGNAMFQVGDILRFDAGSVIGATTIDASNDQIITITANTTVQDILNAMQRQADVLGDVAAGGSLATNLTDAFGNSLFNSGDTLRFTVNGGTLNGNAITALNQDILNIGAATTLTDIVNAITASVTAIGGSAPTVSVDASGRLSITAAAGEDWVDIGFEIFNGTTASPSVAFAPALGSATSLYNLAGGASTTSNSFHLGTDDDVTVTLGDNGNILIETSAVNGDAWSNVSFERFRAGTASPLYAFSPSDLGTAATFSFAAGGQVATDTIHSSDRIDNSWFYQAIVPHEPSQRPSGDSGRLIFNTDGSLSMVTALDGSATTPLRFDPQGAGLIQDPTYEGVDALSITLDFDGLIQFGGASTAAITFQNGNAEGSLDTITIDQNGLIVGIFSNGATRELAQILLATVPNEGGLQKVGESLYQATANSGQPVASVANTRGLGSIQSGTLELSNVDLSRQFTDLVVAQRGFQANARVITTADQVLQEIVSLTR